MEIQQGRYLANIIGNWVIISINFIEIEHNLKNNYNEIKVEVFNLTHISVRQYCFNRLGWTFVFYITVQDYDYFKRQFRAN